MVDAPGTVAVVAVVEVVGVVGVVDVVDVVGVENDGATRTTEELETGG